MRRSEALQRVRDEVSGHLGPLRDPGRASSWPDIFAEFNSLTETESNKTQLLQAALGAPPSQAARRSWINCRSIVPRRSGRCRRACDQGLGDLRCRTVLLGSIGRLPISTASPAGLGLLGLRHLVSLLRWRRPDWLLHPSVKSTQSREYAYLPHRQKLSVCDDQ